MVKFPWVKFPPLFLLPLLLLAGFADARVPDFADLVARNSPAVVKVSSTKKSSAKELPALPQGEEIPDFLREFFERGMPDPNGLAMGSGFILSADGYVITNNHVIDGADTIVVRLMDRQELPAKVVGTDPRSDLALLKVEGENLPTVEFAPADQLRVGEWVIAIGSPFGLDYSASVGIVSAIGRSLPTESGENYVPFIQSDVAINPGNSGGPLFNQDGQVVGINSQIYTRSGGSVGVSFAIPVSVAEGVIAQLRDKGRVERGWLGVYIQDVDGDLAQSLGLDKPVGALISQVIPGSPGERAGFAAGDVIVRFDDKDILESGDLPHEVGLLAPGSKAKVDFIRDGRPRTTAVTVGALPDNIASASEKPAVDDDIGLQVETIDRETAANFNIAGGVVVAKVRPGSPGQYAELQPGDVIVQLGGQTIENVASYKKAVKALPAGVPVLVRFLRQGQFIYRTIEINP